MEGNDAASSYTSYTNNAQNNGAFGHGATYINHDRTSADPGLADIAARLDSLRTLLTLHTNDVADPQAAYDALDAAAAALQDDPPEERGVRLFLNAVVGAAPGVTSIATAVREIIKVAGSLLP
jgi:hypothetical protein